MAAVLPPSLPSPLAAFRALLGRALAPVQGFQARAGQAPGLGAAIRGLLLWRTGPAFLGMLLSYWGFISTYGRITRMEGPLFDYLWKNLPDTANPAELKAAFQALPALPPWTQVAPWLLLLAPLGVLSLWLHDAVWDHACLWLLRGLKGRKQFRLSLVADAEALQVGVIGALLSLLGDLPGIGCLFSLLLAPVGIYFWILRGFALAAWHGCPVWKGVLATLLHGFLTAVIGLGMLALFAFMVLQELKFS
jgi:hypothetical protein